MAVLPYIMIIFIGATAVVAMVVLLANRMERMQEDALVNKKGEKLSGTGALTDEELKQAILEVMDARGQVKGRSREIAESVSKIFARETKKKVESERQELAAKYSVIIEEKENSEKAAWQKYDKVLVDKKETEAVIRSIAEGLVVVDASGNVVMMNPTAEKLLGVSRKDKIGRPLLENLKKEQFVSMAANSTSEEESEIEIISSEDETKKILRSSSAVIENENGQTVGMVSVLSDVTKQRELDRLKTDFVSNVSHELRTPVITVQNAVALLLAGSLGAVNEKQAELLNISKRSLDRLLLMVNDLLDESKLEANKVDLEIAPASVSKLINDVCDGLNAWVMSKAVKIEKNIHKDIPEIDMDYNRMTQVLTNIIGNAVKFTPRGGSVVVEAGLDVRNKNLVVSVSDTGPGIAEKDINKIFDKFYQSGERAPTDISGTGLGLSIAREIVTLHRGKIWAESGKSGGAKFSFTLPVEAVSGA